MEWIEMAVAREGQLISAQQKSGIDHPAPTLINSGDIIARILPRIRAVSRHCPLAIAQ